MGCFHTAWNACGVCIPLPGVLDICVPESRSDSKSSLVCIPIAKWKMDEKNNSWKSFRAGRQSVKKGSGDSVSVPAFALEREYNRGLQKITEKYLYHEEEYDGGNSKTARWQHV